VRRPNRLLVIRNGDDGLGKLVYDGKTLVIYMTDGDKFASIPVPDNIEGTSAKHLGLLTSMLSLGKKSHRRPLL